VITLVLLPGMDGTGELFAPFIAALDGAFEVVVVRYPGDRALGYEALEGIAREALPKDRPFVLLGESFSGPIAVSIAASAPPGLVGLVLCCSFVRNPLPALRRLVWLVDGLPMRLAPVRLLGHLVLGRDSTAALRDALVRSLGQVSPAALKARLRAVLGVDVSAKLETVSVPVLCLRASRDRVVPRSAGALVMRLAPRSQHVEIDASHFLLQGAPNDAARVVRQFASEGRRAQSTG